MCSSVLLHNFVMATRKFERGMIIKDHPTAIGEHKRSHKHRTEGLLSFAGVFLSPGEVGGGPGSVTDPPPPRMGVWAYGRMGGWVGGWVGGSDKIPETSSPCLVSLGIPLLHIAADNVPFKGLFSGARFVGGSDEIHSLPDVRSCTS